MNKKRIVSIIAVMMLVVMTFAGCGNKGPQIDSDLSMADAVQAYTDVIDTQCFIGLSCMSRKAGVKCLHHPSISDRV